jgi:hypothetical protein
VRIDDGDRRRGGHHRFERVAAFAQHLERGLRRQRVRRDRHAARAGDGAERHRVPSSVTLPGKDCYSGAYVSIIGSTPARLDYQMAQSAAAGADSSAEAERPLRMQK